ncbi:MAG TPA: AIPR family protein, partial [Kribbellaceae bacterium]
KDAAGGGKRKLRVEGVGIVNGGQTTAVLGSLDETEAGSTTGAMVMARFVKCTNTSVLGDIVKYNNTQNKVEAADFRSKDAVQDRLRREFGGIPDADYRGGRRGGATNAIQRVKTLIPDSSVAQSLAAFHGEPNLAYNETRSIWDKDAVYARVFRDTVTARHIVYAYGLLKAIEHAKQKILAVPEGSRTDAQKRHADFFSARGSNYLFVAAIGSCIETILGVAVADRYSLQFKKNMSPAEATEAWQSVVDLALAFSGQLTPATDRGLQAQDRVKKALEDFGSMLEAVRSANPVPFDALAEATESTPQATRR